MYFGKIQLENQAQKQYQYKYQQWNIDVLDEI